MRSTARFTAALVTLITGVIASGCMTIDTRVGGQYKGPPTYSGTRQATAGFASSFYALAIDGLIIYGADFPFSLVADTLLLPITIPEQFRYSDQVAEARQVEHDVPSVIDPPAGETTLKTAQRFWDKCVSLTAEARNRLPDCYAVGARIVVPDGKGGTQEITGGVYKEQLRQIMPELRNSTRSVTYIDPTFQVQGDQVRIQAKRADSTVLERTPVSFLVGPGPDGEWRILEQVGEGLPEALTSAK